MVVLRSSHLSPKRKCNEAQLVLEPLFQSGSRGRGDVKGGGGEREGFVCWWSSISLCAFFFGKKNHKMPLQRGREKDISAIQKRWYVVVEPFYIRHETMHVVAVAKHAPTFTCKKKKQKKNNFSDREKTHKFEKKNSEITSAKNINRKITYVCWFFFLFPFFSNWPCALAEVVLVARPGAVVDPVGELGHPDVHPRNVGLRAVHPPRHQADHVPGVKKKFSLRGELKLVGFFCFFSPPPQPNIWSL